MKIKNFTPGDILLITSKTKRGYETRMAQVTCINYNNNGLVTYCGKHSPDFQSTGSSTFDPQNIGKKPFGNQSICIIGYERPWSDSFVGPRPGDRGYDLMC